MWILDLNRDTVINTNNVTEFYLDEDSEGYYIAFLMTEDTADFSFKRRVVFCKIYRNQHPDAKKIVSDVFYQIFDALYSDKKTFNIRNHVPKEIIKEEECND